MHLMSLLTRHGERALKQAGLLGFAELTSLNLRAITWTLPGVKAFPQKAIGRRGPPHMYDMRSSVKSTFRREGWRQRQDPMYHPSLSLKERQQVA